MSNEKTKKTPGWGGRRAGAGRPEGGEMTKICVSVNAKNWQAALSRWKKERSQKAKKSWLVDTLVLDYIGGGSPEMGAAT